MPTFKERISHYPSVALRCLENGFVRNEIPEETTSKQDILTVVLHGIRQIIPVKDKQLEAVFYDTSQLPFPIDSEFLGKVGEGAMSSAYLFRINGNLWVLKISDLIMGDKEALRKSAQKSLQEQNKMREIYQGIPHLIPPEQPIILRGPKGTNPRIGSLQPFQQDAKGFFQIHPTWLRPLLDKHPSLAENVKRFTRITRRCFSVPGQVADILGSNNLLLADRHTNPRLAFVDPHPTPIAPDEDKRASLFEQRLNFLERLVPKQEINQ